MNRLFFFALVLASLVAATDVVGDTLKKPHHWYRGNTHAHSLWSDGNDFPEMIVDWYQRHGYQFLALSDHNVLHQGERWMSLKAIAKRKRAVGKDAMSKYRQRFSEKWIETREVEGQKEVRLKTLEEYRSHFEKAEEFLILQAEEISAKFADKHLHINALNLETTLPPINDKTSIEQTLRENFLAIRKQEEALGRPILAHLNHPNFRWSVSAEVLAQVLEDRFFEVYNGHPVINHMGDETHPSDEKIWDIANTIRITELGAPPMYGIASDDSHTYHGGDVGPGRGWIMVKAPELSPEALIGAMREGAFYASSGVSLESVDYDAATRTLSIKIQPDGDASFSTQLIGTRQGIDLESSQEDIGVVFEESIGLEVRFQIPEDALYARATITSSRPHPSPSFKNQRQQAWVQPVGWR